MGYSSKGKLSWEWASKAQHSHIINDKFVQAYLRRCRTPANSEEVGNLSEDRVLELIKEDNPEIRNIVAVDGGYTEVLVKKEYPSSSVAFFQFGALLFSLDDLDSLGEKPFISPEDMERFRNLSRYKLVLPVKAISTDGDTLVNSIRTAIFEFFCRKRQGYPPFMETLVWLLFKGYQGHPEGEYKLGSSPFRGINKSYILKYSEMTADYTFSFPDGEIFLTDVFRLHEAIDEELGAGGILGYITNLVEQFILAHLIRLLVENRPEALRKTLLLKDGPLAFFGQTANIHKPFREMLNYFREKGITIKIAGLEKSGSFVEHAEVLASSHGGLLEQNTVILLSNDYIYKYILPGAANSDMPYGSTSYYGSKLLFHGESRRVWVISLPAPEKETVLDPKKEKFPCLFEILTVIDKLYCSMYDNALVPIALVNHLVSLADHPSSAVLEKFAANTINNAN